MERVQPRIAGTWKASDVNLGFCSFGWWRESPHSESDEEGRDEEHPSAQGDPLRLYLGEGDFAEFIVVGLRIEGLIVEGLGVGGIGGGGGGSGEESGGWCIQAAVCLWAQAGRLSIEVGGRTGRVCGEGWEFDDPKGRE